MPLGPGQLQLHLCSLASCGVGENAARFTCTSWISPPALHLTCFDLLTQAAHLGQAPTLSLAPAASSSQASRQRLSSDDVASGNRKSKPTF